VNGQERDLEKKSFASTGGAVKGGIPGGIYVGFSGVTTPEAPRKPLIRVLVRVGPAAAPAMSAEGLTVRIIKLRFRLVAPSVSGPFRLHGAAPQVSQDGKPVWVTRMA
jgi:hypothetical protein